VVAAALAGLAAGAAVRYAWLDPEPASSAESAPTDTLGPQPSDIVGTRRPGFALPDLAGNELDIATFTGEVVLLNFWATWCPPCVEEMAALDALNTDRADRGLQVVGVALDDADAVRRFADVHDIDYPLLIGGRDAYTLLRAYGNARTTLPYSVVIDRSGTVRAIHQGAMTQSEAADLVEPYL
jgi:peroxiredoxin